jgi:hypothetical protein
MSGDWTNQLDTTDGCDDEDVVAVVYEIGRRRGPDVDRHMWTVRRYDNDPEPVPVDQAREAYRDRRDGRTSR